MEGLPTTAPIKQPVVLDGVHGGAPPSWVRSLVKPCAGYAALYEISAVLIVRTEPTADDSLADIRARIRFGMAIAAMIRMMATTISSSISEKPFCFRIFCSFRLIFLPYRLTRRKWSTLGTTRECYFRTLAPLRPRL